MVRGKIISGAIRIVCVHVPFLIAFAFDHDLSSQVHIPVIGITGVCVALCDALCGQIIANTRWLPFCACYTPNEAQTLARKFREYHKSMFVSWMVAKICSAFAVTISAVMLVQQRPKLLSDCHYLVFALGYVFLGISLITATEFIISYFIATEEADNAKLREMNYAYTKEHPELFAPDTETVKQQLDGFGNGYTSTPVVAKQV